MTFIIPSSGAALISTFLGVRGTASTGGISFAACDFGQPDPDRYILVGACRGGAGSGVPNMDIGGISATEIAQNADTRRASLWIAHVPTGTSGTIALSGGGDGGAIGWWSLVPLFSPAYFDRITAEGASLIIPDGGVGFAVAYTSGSGGQSIVWTSTYTQDSAVDFSIGGNQGRLSVARRFIFGAADVGASVSNSPPGFAAASFGI